MKNKNKFLPFLVGVIFGIIILLLIVIGCIFKVKHSVVNNYKDDYQRIQKITKDSVGPATQMDYIITGEVLSPTFIEYLNDGVIKGWWTQDYLDQFLTDRSLPILFGFFFGVIGVVLDSDKAKDATIRIDDGIEKLMKVELLLNQNKGNIYAFKNKLFFLKRELIDLKKTISNKELRSKIDITINKINNLINKINELEKLDLNEIAKNKVNIYLKAHKIEIEKEVQDEVDKYLKKHHDSIIAKIKAKIIIELLKNPVVQIIKNCSLDVIDDSHIKDKYSFLNIIELDITYKYNGKSTPKLGDDVIDVTNINVAFEYYKDNSIDLILGQGYHYQGAKALGYAQAIKKANKLI